MLIVTINEIPAKSWKRWAWCAAARCRAATLATTDGRVPHPGGRRGDRLRDMLTEARQIATGRMVKDAEALGADAL